MKKLILASQSPRRQELLERLGVPFTVCPAQGEETIVSMPPPLLVEKLAMEKATEIAESNPEAVVLGADTLVILDGTVLGKPKDEEEAVAMLGSLQGRSHQVYTGVALVTPERRWAFHQVTVVRLCSLTEGQIRHYVAQGESLDKAGAYGVQGMAAAFVESIQGDFFNAMGLPLHAVATALGECGLGLFAPEEGEGHS